MSVMLPQLSKAIMSICSALFIESLSMFSHETPDPLNQSPLNWALETCLFHVFSPPQLQYEASEISIIELEKCEF